MSASVFVQLIEKYPCIYNSTIPEYSRKDITDRAWAEISQQINWPAEECKEKWKNIRNGFVRSLKHRTASFGTSTKNKKKYYMHDELQFIVPFVKAMVFVHPTPNSAETSIPETNNEDSNIGSFNTTHIEEENAESPEPPFKKRKVKPTSEVDKAFIEYLKDKKSSGSGNDYRKMFLLSLLPEVQKLSEQQMREFKIKTLILLDEISTRPTPNQVVYESVPVPPTPVALTPAATIVPVGLAPSPLQAPMQNQTFVQPKLEDEKASLMEIGSYELSSMPTSMDFSVPTKIEIE